MGVQLDVHGATAIARLRPAAGTSAGRRRSRKTVEGAAVGQRQLEVVAAQRAAASTSGPRPATPRGPPRPSTPATAAGAPPGSVRTATRCGGVETARGRASELGVGSQHRPALGHPRGGVDREDLQQRLRRPARRAPRAPPRRGGGGAARRRRPRARAGRAAGGPRPTARSRSDARRARQRLEPRRQHAAQDPRRGARPAEALLDAPAAAAGEQGAEAQRRAGSCPCRCGAASRRSTSSSRARSSWRPAVPSGSSISSASSSCGRRGRSGSSSPRQRRSASQRRAARSGRRPGRRRARRTPPGVSIPSRSQRLDQLLGLALRSSRSRGPQRRRPGPAAANRRRRGRRRSGCGRRRSAFPSPTARSRRRQDAGGGAAVEAAQTVEGEERLARPLRLDRGAERLQRPHHRLGRLRRLDRVGKIGAPGPRPPGTIRARRSRQAFVDDAGDLHTNICSYPLPRISSIEATASSQSSTGGCSAARATFAASALPR